MTNFDNMDFDLTDDNKIRASNGKVIANLHIEEDRDGFAVLFNQGWTSSYETKSWAKCLQEIRHYLSTGAAWFEGERPYDPDRPLENVPQEELLNMIKILNKRKLDDRGVDYDTLWMSVDHEIRKNRFKWSPGLYYLWTEFEDSKRMAFDSSRDDERNYRMIANKLRLFRNYICDWYNSRPIQTEDYRTIFSFDWLKRNGPEIVR